MQYTFSNHYTFRATEYNNVTAPLHANLEMEIVLVHEGVVNMNVNGIEHEIRAGEGIFILPFISHDFRSLQGNVCHVLMFCEQYSETYFKQVGRGSPIKRIFPISNPLHTYLKEQLKRSEEKNVSLNYSILCPLFEAIHQNCQFEEKITYQTLFLDTLAYIDRHLTEPLTER